MLSVGKGRAEALWKPASSRDSFARIRTEKSRESVQAATGTSGLRLSRHFARLNAGDGTKPGCLAVSTKSGSAFGIDN